MLRKRVLITGGAGFLALNWAMSVRDVCDVTLGLHQRDISLDGVGTHFISLDSLPSILDAFEHCQPEIVIHTVALTNVEHCEADPILAKHVNVELARNVAKGCALAGIQMVHISTDHLFSGKVAFVDEEYPVAPINVYGKTKAEAESQVLDAYPQTLVIRTNFYGWGPNYRQSFSDVIIETLRAGMRISLFDDVMYTPIGTDSLVRAVHDLLGQSASGIFQVVGDDRLSKFDFGMRVAEEFGLDTTLIQRGFMADQTALVQRPYDMSLSNQKACNHLGRQLGGVREHLGILRRQEQGGFAREMGLIGR